MQREVGRLKRELSDAEKRLQASRAQAAREEEAESRRSRGVAVSTPKPAAAADGSACASSGGAGALVAQPPGALVGRPAAGYVRDIDLSPFAKAWLSREAVGLRHTWQDTRGPTGGAEGHVVVTGLDAAHSEIHASIKEKRGKRSLFYDLSLWLQWTATSKAAGAGGEMTGVIKLYNVAQDTRFQLGGDKETCYMYELGFPQQFHGATAPWAERIREEAAELFEIAAQLVIKRLVPAIEAKGELVK